MKQLLKRIPRRLYLLLLAAVLVLFSAFFLKNHVFLSEDQRFENFTCRLFQEEIRANTLNLHYTLAYPESYGIKDYSISLGSMDPDTMEDSRASLETLQNKLEDFSVEKLSQQNQMTYDILRLELSTELSPGNDPLLQEPLGPNLGIQAQLPVLLAEYTFRSPSDIRDYFSLLACLPEYFQEILAFEQEKSSKGLFMSDISADRIIAQCLSFTGSSDEHYLNSMFREQVTELAQQKKLSQKQVDSYLAMQEKLMEECVLPAYTQLQQGISQLKGTGKNENGLSHLPGGKAYYEYLIQSTVGDYRSPEEISQRLYRQLASDSQEMLALKEQNPQILTQAAQASSPCEAQPEEMLEYLNTAMTQDFPHLDAGDYQVKYVPESMEEFSSPAFYLTPPIDTLSPNTIYINQSSQVSGTELFTTLAHEGFPGHLYQTLSFGNTHPSPIRDLLSCSGYIEGWATYVESLSYGYAADFLGISPDVMQFLWQNRSMTLCLYSLLDLGIHDQGWTFQTAFELLQSFGIAQEETCREIFQYIVENPANYLKYYLGYLNFCDLRSEIQEKQRDAFSSKDFHSALLALGPAQFPVVEKYLLASYK
ncbi:MAG TPA: DUF885 domain-containing protein [Candidatus Blautia merdavium]|uniref:DUF885 domain-containing protein n=1 Tax=Candidatus Blautia merdavium TaxID=2838494 RepID=A0A9D2TAS3_9FIRM|nr:DUF885 domain-containing protein [Candidatus Blautia merdavium]